jgi:hypothetical protein
LFLGNFLIFFSIVANNKFSGTIPPALLGMESLTYLYVFNFFEEEFGIRNSEEEGGRRKEEGRRRKEGRKEEGRRKGGKEGEGGRRKEEGERGCGTGRGSHSFPVTHHHSVMSGTIF